jgi:hypothetical protein
MKNLFDAGIADEIRQRIHSITPATTPRWGKMNIAQMLAHCQRPMEMALGEIPVTPAGFFKKILGRMIKGVITSPKPYKQGLPTDPSFITTATAHDFNLQKEKLLTTLDRYLSQQDKIADIPHPFFGKLTKVECGTSQYKHLDHHLTQFGV